MSINTLGWDSVFLEMKRSGEDYFENIILVCFNVSFKKSCLQTVFLKF